MSLLRDYLASDLRFSLVELHEHLNYEITRHKQHHSQPDWFGVVLRFIDDFYFLNSGGCQLSCG